MKDIETIYSDIPLPPKRQGPQSSRWEKFVNMKVGDCVFLKTRIDANSLTTYLKNKGISTVSRKVDNQIGIWRVEEDG